MTDLYCPYCGEPKGEKISCHDEADWVDWDDLPDEFKDTEGEECYEVPQALRPGADDHMQFRSLEDRGQAVYHRGHI